MNVIWDLAPHGVSVANYLAHCLPTSVRALCLKADASRTKEESALIHMQYPDFSAIVKANWQYPLKERKVIAVGTKQMIQFDDVNNATPISIFEKSAIPHGIRPGADYGSFKLITRDGGTYLPVVKLRAPLQTQLVDFYEAMRTGKAPLASARNGAEVVRILEATDESLRNNGGEVPLTW
jgi:predicted dehydrogenase